MKTRWSRDEALPVAAELCRRLKPVTERLIVAGSLRRRRAAVGDVEILYIPRTEDRPADLFRTQTFSLADEEINAMLAEGIIEKRESATSSRDTDAGSRSTSSPQRPAPGLTTSFAVPAPRIPMSGSRPRRRRAASGGTHTAKASPGLVTAQQFRWVPRKRSSDSSGSATPSPG
jgi:hypothetical protein